MDAERWTAVADAVAETIADLDAVMAAVREVIRERVPAYGSVPEGELRAASTRNVRAILVALGARRPLTARELEGFTQTVEERARAGVAIDDYLLAVATAEEAMWQQLRLRAPDLSDRQLADVHALRLAHMNAVTRVTASAHRRIEVSLARQDQQRRTDAMRSILSGRSDPGEAEVQLAVLGLSPEHEHHVVRARRLAGPADHDDLLVAGGRASQAFVLWGEDLVGLTTQRPPAVEGMVVGVAGPAPVGRLGAAHDLATLACDAAAALGTAGVWDVAALGIAVAVQAVPELGAVVRRRYLDPVHGAGRLGEELLATVRTFLEVGSRRDVAAERLHVHENTVTYRLGRFGELTGADLSDLRTVAELHWLFTDLDLRP